MSTDLAALDRFDADAALLERVLPGPRLGLALVNARWRLDRGRTPVRLFRMRLLIRAQELRDQAAPR